MQNFKLFYRSIVLPSQFTSFLSSLLGIFWINKGTVFYLFFLKRRKKNIERLPNLTGYVEKLCHQLKIDVKWLHPLKGGKVISFGVTVPNWANQSRLMPSSGLQDVDYSEVIDHYNSTYSYWEHAMFIVEIWSLRTVFCPVLEEGNNKKTKPSYATS